MTGSPLLWLFLLQFLFIFVNALFASAEIAVLTMNKNRLVQLSSTGDKRAVLLTELIEQPAAFGDDSDRDHFDQPAEQCSGSANFSVLGDWFVRMGSAHPLLVNILSVAYYHFDILYRAFGELIPKRLAMKR